MFKFFTFLFVISFSLNVFALEISLESAKANFQPYSTFHLKDNTPFLCQEKLDDFGITTEVICAFSKKPSQKIRKIQNDFFEIDTAIKESGYFLIIKPNHKMKLFPLVFDMIHESDVYKADVKLSKHWMLVGYLTKLPYIKEEKRLQSGINFPFVMKKDTLPYVGGLDLKGNPVHIKKVQDVTDYIKIKKYYKNQKYYKCLDLITSILSNYPNTLFRAELLFYKIKVFSQLKDYDSLIDVSKEYLKEYSSDENVAEILSLSANAYAKTGLNIDADYFFDRLFTEHQDSEYSKWGYLYKGEMFEASGGSKQALKFYKKAYFSAKTIDLAATAAYKIALFQANNFKLKESAIYIKKILKVMPEYFSKDLKASMELMNVFAEAEHLEMASSIATALLHSMDKNHDEYEKLLKDKAIWLSKTKDKAKALQALNQYIKEFPYGTYELEIKVAKDALFFDTTDDNTSVRLAHYDELIEEYKKETIGKRALYEKSKLLLEVQRYDDVLALREKLLQLNEDEFSDVEKIITQAAIGSMQNNLKKNNCQEVLDISNEYNITLSNEWDDGVYKCAMKGGDFILSKRVANSNLKVKNLEIRKVWLYRYIKVDFATGNYSDVIDASKDLISLIDDSKAENKFEYIDVYRYLFDTYQRLEKKQAMLEAIKEIENIFGIVNQDIERYLSVMAVGSDLKDDNMVIKYATIIMQLQKKSKTYVQTPFVEFTLFQAYVNKEDYTKALDVIESLNDKKLSKEKRSRQKYLLGFTYNKLWREEEAMIAYEEAIKADPKSSWAELAKSAKSF